MEESHEIVIGCFAGTEDIAAVKFDWFIDEYAADHQLEYFFVESIRRLPAEFGNFIIRQKREENATILDNITQEIFAAMASGDPELSDELTKEYLKINNNYFDHRVAVFYNVDDDALALPLMDDKSMFFIRVVVFQ